MLFKSSLICTEHLGPFRRSISESWLLSIITSGDCPVYDWSQQPTASSRHAHHRHQVSDGDLNGVWRTPARAQIATLMACCGGAPVNSGAGPNTELLLASIAATSCRETAVCSVNGVPGPGTRGRSTEVRSAVIKTATYCDWWSALRTVPMRRDRRSRGIAQHRLNKIVKRAHSMQRCKVTTRC